jgi:BolA family transcriptional regulator, general stress-responsive regulator
MNYAGIRRIFLTRESKITRAERIAAILAVLDPCELVITNNSALHHGHAGDDGSGETHFQVRVVAKIFSGKSRIACSRMVNDLLATEFAAGLHAVSYQLITPSDD